MTDPQTGPPQAPPPQPPAPSVAASAQHSPGQVPPQRSSRAPIFIVLGIVFGCGALAALCFLSFVVIGLVTGGPSETWEYTHDQKRILGEFGPPETFTLMYAGDMSSTPSGDEEPPPVRLETWEYHTLGATFTFRDGAFVARQRIPIPAEPRDYPAVRPDLFVAGMSGSDVEKAVDAEPGVVAAAFPEAIEGLELHSYADELVVGFQDDGLVTARTYGVYMDEGGD